jgi:hypothetical protein
LYAATGSGSVAPATETVAVPEPMLEDAGQFGAVVQRVSIEALIFVPRGNVSVTELA